MEVGKLNQLWKCGSLYCTPWGLGEMRTSDDPRKSGEQQGEYSGQGEASTAWSPWITESGDWSRELKQLSLGWFGLQYFVNIRENVYACFGCLRQSEEVYSEIQQEFKVPHVGGMSLKTWLPIANGKIPAIFVYNVIAYAELAHETIASAITSDFLCDAATGLITMPFKLTGKKWFG